MDELEDNRSELVDQAAAMRRLLDNEDFTLLFEEGFMKAFAITNAYNAWSFDIETKNRFMEKTMARGYFAKYIQDIITDGENALSSLREESEDEQSAN